MSFSGRTWSGPPKVRVDWLKVPPRAPARTGAEPESSLATYVSGVAVVKASATSRARMRWTVARLGTMVPRRARASVLPDCLDRRPDAGAWGDTGGGGEASRLRGRRDRKSSGRVHRLVECG